MPLVDRVNLSIPLLTDGVREIDTDNFMGVRRVGRHEVYQQSDSKVAVCWLVDRRTIFLSSYSPCSGRAGTCPRPFAPAWLRLLSTPVFTARRNARIASAVLAKTIPSVCPSVCLSHAGIVSKRLYVARCSLHCHIAKCVQFCRNQKIFPRDDPFPLKSWLELTCPLLIAASLDTFCLVAPQR